MADRNVIPARLFSGEYDRRFLARADATEEGAHVPILLDGDRGGALHERAREDELPVFDFVRGGVGAEVGVDLDGVGHLVNVEACGKLEADCLAEGFGFEDYRVLARLPVESNGVVARDDRGLEDEQAILHGLRVVCGGELNVERKAPVGLRVARLNLRVLRARRAAPHPPLYGPREGGAGGGP